jgi:radical SAM protein with 4Fe4S-binding SPASM domain
MSLDEKTRLFAPIYQQTVKDGIALLIDPFYPHWIATNDKGAEILSYVDGKKSLGDIISIYRNHHQVSFASGWLDCQTFLQDAIRAGFLSLTPFVRASYQGRSQVISTKRLSELWMHVTNACNLSCSHCLVSSSPQGIAGETTPFWKDTIAQAIALGTNRFYITGGEPFLRADIFDMADLILPYAELIILTNAILLKGERLKKLALQDPNRLKLQISLDGPTAELNDPIRGAGSFDATLKGIKEAVSAGFSPTLTTVVTQSNIAVLPLMMPLASSLGIKNVHLLLSHHRGRATEFDSLSSPPNELLLETFLKLNRLAHENGITLDNIETLKGRLLGRAGVKFDLMNMAYESLCVYADGTVYPSAALAGIPDLKMGSLLYQSLADIWQNGEIAKNIRNATVQKKQKCKDCYLKFLCGGGDMEHTYHHSQSFLGEDPFSTFHENLILEILFLNAREKTVGTPTAMQKNNLGYNRPVVISAMGEDAIADHEDKGIATEGGFEVAIARSGCVLSVEIDKARKVVRDFYTQAAESADPKLCCTGGYSREDVSHIPQGALDISYGCGSPVPFAQIVPGEVVVDLGAGGGIDCFVMAKKVGASGRVVGIDMTDAMLKKANQFKEEVASRLGYSVVAFHKGFLEAVPLPDSFADVVLSNCVINLSANKRNVLLEIFRVLKDFGRAVISDTVSEKPLPQSMKSNPRLWGECVSGAMTEEQYLAELERAGFYGLSVVKKDFWKEVEGNRFYSVVLTGYKFKKQSTCDYVGQKAVYLGPMQAVIDEEGHLFPRNQEVEICTDTAAKLQNPPYNKSFLIIGEASNKRDAVCNTPQCC